MSPDEGSLKLGNRSVVIEVAAGQMTSPNRVDMETDIREAFQCTLRAIFMEALGKQKAG